LQQLFAEALDVPLTVPENPQIVGALGAALHAAQAAH
jgi:activator of 2-hydroxyglutaryl-CoA dehydratase